MAQSSVQAGAVGAALGITAGAGGAWLYLRRRQVLPAEAQIGELTDALKAVQAERDQLRADLAVLTRERDTCAQERERAASTLQGCLAERDQFQERVRALTQERDQLRAQLQAVTRERDALAAELAQFRVLAEVALQGYGQRTQTFLLTAPLRVRVEYELQSLFQYPNCWVARSWVWVREAGRPEPPTSEAGQAASVVADSTGPLYMPSNCYGAPQVVGKARSKEVVLPPGRYELGVNQDLRVSIGIQSRARVVAL